MSEAVTDHYAVLGVSPDSTAREIRRGYFAKAKEYHPDRHPNATEEERQQHNANFRKVWDSYEVLSDETEKRSYDAQRAAEMNARASNDNSNNRTSREQQRSPQNPSARSSQTNSNPSASNTYYPRQQHHNGFGGGFGSGGTHPFGSERNSHRRNTSTNAGFGSHYTSGSNPFQSRSSRNANNFGQQSGNSSASNQRRSRRHRHDYSNNQEEYARQQREQEQQQQRQCRQAEAERQRREQQARAWQQRHYERERQREQSQSHHQERSQAWDPHHPSHSRSPPRTFGKTQKGEDCKNCIKQGCYCWQHKYQDPNDPENRRRRRQPSEREQQGPSSSRYATNRRPTNCGQSVHGHFGVTQKGEACKRCLKQGGYCYQHYDQR